MTARNKLLSGIREMLAESADTELRREDVSMPFIKAILDRLGRFVSPAASESLWLPRSLAQDADRHVEELMRTGRTGTADDVDLLPGSKAAQVASLRLRLLVTLDSMVTDLEHFGVSEISDPEQPVPVSGSRPLLVAARLLGRRHRNRYVEEWMAHLGDLPKRERVICIWSLILSIPWMVIALRWPSRRKRR